jgi:ankyrin repeat protein
MESQEFLNEFESWINGVSEAGTSSSLAVGADTEYKKIAMTLLGKSPYFSVTLLLLRPQSVPTIFLHHDARQLFDQISHEEWMKIIHFLLDSETDLNDHQDSSCLYTVLHIAVEAGIEDLVSLFLSLGADVNLSNSKGATPLITAAGKGNEQIVQLLLDHSADFTLSDHYGTTAVLRATCWSNVDIVKILILAGADTETADKFGYTPLLRATLHQDKAMIAVLVAEKKKKEDRHCFGVHTLKQILRNLISRITR